MRWFLGHRPISWFGFTPNCSRAQFALKKKSTVMKFYDNNFSQLPWQASYETTISCADTISSQNSFYSNDAVHGPPGLAPCPAPGRRLKPAT